MKIYGLKTCDKVRAAIRALEGAGLVPELVDIRAQPLEHAEIERFFEAFGEALVNRRSATWRGLTEAERAGDPVRLLSAHPALMKRPVIEAAGRLTLGWDAQAKAVWLGKAPPGA
ncbi:MAG: arsenate reductase [Rhodobacterales bacterium]|nr:MAG: arsenate reductase [Rhodobacterales bacterium]